MKLIIIPTVFTAAFSSQVNAQCDLSTTHRTFNVPFETVVNCLINDGCREIDIIQHKTTMRVGESAPYEVIPGKYRVECLRYALINTPSPNPPAPATPSPTPASTGSAAISWDAPIARVDGSPLDVIDGYKVTVWNDGSYGMEFTVEVTEILLTDLEPGTYSFYVVTLSGGQESDQSEQVNFEIL